MTTVNGPEDLPDDFGHIDGTPDPRDAEIHRLRSVIYQSAHLAATLGSGSDGWLRGRFMSISNALNAAIGRTQSSHGEQYDNAGNVVRDDPLNT